MTHATDRDHRHLWFLNTLVTIRVAAGDGAGGTSILEHCAPHGDSPPLHLHHDEDEVFCLLEGEMRFQIGEEERRATAGAVLLAPMGVPHTYRVESSEGARWLTVTANRGFERMVRSVARPAPRAELPMPSRPTPAQIGALVSACRESGIDIVGAPLA
jgi:mannose-6-phosphate isomerase-like protein (cupin superfamily)